MGDNFLKLAGSGKFGSEKNEGPYGQNYASEVKILTGC